MYLCWDSTSETALQKVAQTMEVRKDGGLDNETAGIMMSIT
jgi:hypothetical protein